MTQTTASAVDTTPVDAPTALRGIPLLDLVIAQIELSPQTWHQEDWRCESGMCVAGWTAHLSGGEWLTPANDEFGSSLLCPEPGESGLQSVATEAGARLQGVPARYRAAHLLGIDDDAADDLFEADNTLDYIKECRDRIADGRVTPRYEDDEELVTTTRITVQLDAVTGGEERVLRLIQRR